MRKMLIVALACAVFGIGLAGESQATKLQAIGGGGGGEFQTSCEPGDQLVGVDVVSTNVIVSIAPVCGNRRKSALDTYGRPWVGGQDGPWRKLRCPPRSVLTVLHVFIDKTPLVSKVEFACWNIDTNKMDNVVVQNSRAQVTRDVNLTCPIGEIGTAIYGRAGTAIDQLGLVCEKWQVAEAPPAAPVPPPAAPVPQTPRQQFVKVLLDSDVYNAKGGGGQPISVLRHDTPGVTLVEPCSDNWCHVKWPAGQGWVYDGPGYDALQPVRWVPGR
jgi:hypothetical protein